MGRKEEMRASAPEISDLRLEQYVLGELSLADVRKLREALEKDESLRARLSAIRQSDQEILARYPPERIAEVIRQRIPARETPREFPRRSPALMVALPAAAAVLVFLSMFVVRDRFLPGMASPAAAEVRLKGAQPHLSIYRKGPEGAEELSNGSSATQRDWLQLTYTAADARYGVIFSIDGRGTLTWHLPTRIAPSQIAPALDQQGQVALASAYELDDAPSFERFFFVYSSRPFELRDVERAASGLASKPQAAEKAALSLPKDEKQWSLVIKKR
jgi:hypothetical protein